MEQRAFRRATGIASVLQLAAVLLGLAVPSLAEQNFYPIAGTLLAVLAGWLFAHWSRSGRLKLALVGGAVAGGMSSLAGVLLTAFTGQASPGAVTTVLVATVTGTLSGAVGGFFGKLFSSQRASA